MRSSAGKNDSIDSSATVTSTAVPNVVTVLMNASSPSGWRRRSGTAIAPAARSCAGAGGRRRGSRRAPRAARRAPGRRSRPPRGPAGRGGARATRARLAMRGAMPSGCRLDAQDVDRRLEQVVGDGAVSSATPRLAASMPQWRSTTSAGYGSCAASSRSSASRTGPISGLVEPALPVDGRVARGEQQLVALAQRHVELLGEVHDHLGARPRAARLHEARGGGPRRRPRARGRAGSGAGAAATRAAAGRRGGAR